MTADEKQVQDKYLSEKQEWALLWLECPEGDLPGTLTHDKCQEVYDAACSDLLDLRLGGQFYREADGRMSFAGYSDD